MKKLIAAVSLLFLAGCATGYAPVTSLPYGPFEGAGDSSSEGTVSE